LKIIAVISFFIISTRPAQPRRIPITLYPSRNARIVTARIAGFKPGTSPPPVKIPITPGFLVFIVCLLEYDPAKGFV